MLKISLQCLNGDSSLSKTHKNRVNYDKRLELLWNTIRIQLKESPSKLAYKIQENKFIIKIKEGLITKLDN